VILSVIIVLSVAIIIAVGTVDGVYPDGRILPVLYETCKIGIRIMIVPITTVTMIIPIMSIAIGITRMIDVPPWARTFVCPSG